MEGGANLLEPVGQKQTFFSHVFSTTEESKAEILNITQYSILGIIPIVCLNKMIQRFIPDADSDKSSVEILIEVLIQLIAMFVGIIFIHRMITYFPTYSEFKYDSLTLTNVVLAFLVIILSIQTKIGLKVNILLDRVLELWNGPNYDQDAKRSDSDRRRAPMNSQSNPYEQSHNEMLPNPVMTSKQDVTPDIRGSVVPTMDVFPANGVLGGGFGSSF